MNPNVSSSTRRDTRGVPHARRVPAGDLWIIGGGTSNGRAHSSTEGHGGRRPLLLPAMLCLRSPLASPRCWLRASGMHVRSCDDDDARGRTVRPRAYVHVRQAASGDGRFPRHLRRHSACICACARVRPACAFARAPHPARARRRDGAPTPPYEQQPFSTQLGHLVHNLHVVVSRKLCTKRTGRFLNSESVFFSFCMALIHHAMMSCYPYIIQGPLWGPQ